MEDIIEVHKYSSNNRKYLLKSNICGCFSCLRIFSSYNITEWINSENTALCPYCGIDSIIPENSGYPITTEFLTKMNNYWFNEE